MPRPESYQMGFDFNRSNETTALPRSASLTAFYPNLAGLDAREENLGRFVRVVQDEIVVRSPIDVAQHLLQHVFTLFDDFDQEELWVLLLNTKNRITHESMIYRGTLNTVQIRLAEVFKPAIRINSHAILLSHCHPSGDPTPSPEDVHVTEEAVRAGQLLGIPLLDHHVIGKGSWVSLKERGLGFEAKNAARIAEESFYLV